MKRSFLQLNSSPAFAPSCIFAWLSLSFLVLALRPGLVHGQEQTVTPPVPAPEYQPAPPAPEWQPPAPASHAAPGIFAAAPLLQSDPAASPFRYGPLLVRPHLQYRLLHGDGIQFQPGRQLTTTVENLSPGLLLELGSRWRADYTLVRTTYSNSEFADTVDHSALLAGVVGKDAWSLGLNQTYSSTSGPLIETGQPTDQELYGTTVTSAIRLSGQFWLDLQASQTLQFVRQFSDSREWATMDWVHYRFPGELDVAAGAGTGIVKVSEGPDMNFVRAQVRIGWHLGDKLQLDAEAGLEHRRFSDSSRPARDNPILNLSLRYQFLEPTFLTVDASRFVATSYFADQFVEHDKISAGIQQRLLTHFFLDASYAYEKMQFLSAVSNGVGGRDDDIRSVNLRLRTTLLRRVTVAVFYQRTSNASNDPTFAFGSDQVGLEMGVQF